MTDTYAPNDMGALVALVAGLSLVGADNLRDWAIGCAIDCNAMALRATTNAAFTV